MLLSSLYHLVCVPKDVKAIQKSQMKSAVPTSPYLLSCSPPDEVFHGVQVSQFGDNFLTAVVS